MAFKDDRDEKARGVPSEFYPDHESWLAGALAWLYELMAEAYQRDHAGSEGDLSPEQGTAGEEAGAQDASAPGIEGVFDLDFSFGPGGFGSMSGGDMNF